MIAFVFLGGLSGCSNRRADVRLVNVGILQEMK